MFERIAIVNRGEAAVRLIKAVRELNAEYDYNIRTVALHTEAERRALFVRQADEAVVLDKPASGSAYLDYGVLERALVASKADAVWVGWGFVAEDPGFAELCGKLGITFIGPSPDAMRLLGDKVEAKLLAEKVGVPVAPWSGGPVETRADARRHAQAIGYPLIIKARSGGGGRGIRKVFAEDELELALERTQGEAARSFGDPVVFLERLVTEARHVEVQVIADSHGNVWAPGVRDCSIQRKNQKVIEESSSPVMSKEQADNLRSVSADLVRASGYCGAATVEYLFQPEQNVFTFLEVNTRLQVEHPITEVTTGLDLVKLQIHVASGGILEGDRPPEWGHAVEARLNAEDADNGFAPAQARCELLRWPPGSGIRVDSGIAEGDVIPPDYDSMVAKIIAWGKDRSEATARLRRALRETTVVLDGGTTTKSFLLNLLDRDEVISGSADTGWLDRTRRRHHHRPDPACRRGAARRGDPGLRQRREARARRLPLLRPWRAAPRQSRHRPQGRAELPRPELQVRRGPGRSARLPARDHRRPLEVEVDRLGEYEFRITVGSTPHQVVSIAGPTNYLVEVDGVAHQISQDEAGLVRTPAPAVVVAVPVAVGDTVEAGDTLVVLESMKMETAVRAPYAGRIREVNAIVNSQVDAGAPLLRVDKVEATRRTLGYAWAWPTKPRPAPAVEFSVPEAAGADTRADALSHLEAFEAMITGYDVSAERARELLKEYEALRDELPRDDAELNKAERELLLSFADVCDMSRHRPTVDELDLTESVHSPREHFHSYLLSLDVEVEGLPDSFRSRLLRALRRYDVTELEHSTELEDAVYRLYLALQRIDNQVPVVAGLLERRLTDQPPTSDSASAVSDLLDRLISATQVRYPVIGDIARNLRFRYFVEPQIAKARSQVYDGARGSLTYLVEQPDAPDYQERIDALVESAEPLTGLLAKWTGNVAPLLEAITRQYYRIRQLEDYKTFGVGENHYVTASFDLAGERINLVSTVATLEALQTTLAEVDEIAGPNPLDLVVDIYLRWADAPADGDELVAALQEKLAAYPATASWRRTTITIVGETDTDVRFVTFRPVSTDPADGLGEDRIIRDMHPLTGQRVNLWRLKNFDGTRLAAPPQTYLFHIVAKENSSDQRLVAMAEVRDVTLQRDEAGEIVTIPAFERALSACMNGIRREQARRGNRRLDNNRVVLYVWPVLEVPLPQVESIAGHIAPLTAGAGLEEVQVVGRFRESADAPVRELAIRFSYRAGAGVVVNVTEPPTEPMRPLDEYTQKVQRSRARGTVYPYELIPILTGAEGSVHRIRPRRRRRARPGRPAVRT